MVTILDMLHPELDESADCGCPACSREFKITERYHLKSDLISESGLFFINDYSMVVKCPDCNQLLGYKSFWEW